MSNLSPKFTPRTYADARKVLTDAGKSRIPLCYATALQHNANGYAIYHHDTAIVTWHADGSITLTGNGWASQTTANRMRHFTPHNVRVNARKGTLTVTVDDVVVGDATCGLTIHPTN